MFQEKYIKNVKKMHGMLDECGEERMVRAIIIKMKDPEFLPLEREGSNTICDGCFTWGD